MVAAKKNTKKDLEARIAQLEAKLTKLVTQIETKPPEPKPAETKPTEPKKDTLPKGSQPKPTEVQKPAETAKQPPATFDF